MSFSTRKIAQHVATVCTTMAVVFSSLLISVGSAPEASASSSSTAPYVNTASNKGSFTHGSFLEIRLKATGKSGAGIHGKAKVYVNGHHLQTRNLVRGRAQFRIDRARLPDNKTADVKVHVYPSASGYSMAVKHWYVKDVPQETDGEKIVEAAKSQVGSKYRYGAAGPSARGYDCSGLVQYAVKKATGRTLPHSSAAQKNSGRQISASDARAGDLLYVPGHIAVYSGGGRVIEAATPATGVVERKIWQSNPTFIRI